MAVVMTKKLWFLVGGIALLFLGTLIVVLALTLGRGSDMWEGLLFQPRTDDHHLIRFKSRNIGVWGPLVAELGVFLEKYSRPSSGGHIIVACDWSSPPRDGEVCAFDIRNLGAYCSAEHKYGYEEGKPCVFIYSVMESDWVPEYFETSKNLPDEMPPELKSYIETVEVTDRRKLNTLWLSCSGEDPADEENLGSRNYSQWHGFPSYYFPNKGGESYLSPLVAVKFTSLKVGIAVNVKCRVWAKNLGQYEGFVKFQILVD